MAEDGSRPSVAPAGTSKLLGLAVFVAAALAVGWLGSIAISAGAPSWYAGLSKPGFMPPDAVFGAVWTVLYVLMGVAAWLVWLEPGSIVRNAALMAYFVQLALNAAWAWAFFGAQSTGLGLAAILALFLAVAWMVIAALAVSRPAAILFLPTLVWVGLVAALNTVIFLLN